jgi:hypothetical protein
LGETKGLPGLLPHWEDDRRLTLDGDKAVVILDLDAKLVPKPLPGYGYPFYHYDGQTRLVAFCQKRYSAAWRRWVSTMAKLEKPAKLGEFLGVYPPIMKPKPREFLLLRSLGIPPLYDSLGQLPVLACSPDGAFLARPVWFPYELNVQPFGPEDRAWRQITLPGTYLEVFEANSGTRVWRSGPMLPRPRRLPANRGLQNPPEYPWTQPTVLDLRWSPDGRYLSFTTHGNPTHPEIRRDTVTVVEVGTWKTALRFVGAKSAFVIPRPG